MFTPEKLNLTSEWDKTFAKSKRKIRLLKQERAGEYLLFFNKLQ